MVNKQDENRFRVSTLAFVASLIASVVVAYAAGRAYRSRYLNHSNALPTSHQVFPSDIQSVQSSFEVSADGSLSKPRQVLTTVDTERYRNPTGQHLIVDIENVDGDFLNSQKRLGEAMVTLVETSGLTMISHHCHDIEPVGVSCAGILAECHLTLHTWPLYGVITLDLFACGNRDLLPFVGRISSLFGISQTSSSPSEENAMVEEPHIQWALKNRGFDRDEDPKNPEDVDLDELLLSWLDFELKEEVVSVQTDYQKLQIFDLINPRFRRLESYKRSLSKDGSYESQHPEFFRPDRIVYLDKIMQSRYYGQKEYHETLVHPAMFAHSNPKRVAIIGGGEGATLREVLKHKTVQGVTMVEIDKEVVEVCRRFLPEWSSCEDIVGSRPSCFDDPRATVVYTDAIAWFLERFGVEAEVKEEERFDVIIMDALDPTSVVDFSDALYNNSALIAAISNALTADGVLTAQLGQVLPLSPRDFTRQSVVDTAFIPLLENNGFKKIKEYAEGHGGLLWPWSYLVAFKDRKAVERWYANSAVVDFAIKQRISPTVSGGPALHFFDGGLMNAYSYPSRIVETNFCRQHAMPELCSYGHGFDPEKGNAPISSFEVRDSSIPGAGRGVFFKESFPNGTYLAIEKTVDDILILPMTLRIIKQFSTSTSSSKWSSLDAYIIGYGFASDFYGDPAFLVDACILTFLNHGCNSTDNMGMKLSVSEMTADPDRYPPELGHNYVEDVVYSPFADRNHLIYITIDEINRDVNADEELKDNYLSYLHDDNWKWGVEHLRAMCTGQGKGIVTEYEAGSPVESTELLG